MQFFESIRCGFLDSFFTFFSFLGESTPFTVAIILCYWLFGRAGEQLAVSALTTFPFNVFIKATVARPRPYVQGTVERVYLDNTFVDTTSERLGDYASFPSGHAQNSSTFLTGVALRAKRAWVAVVCLALTLLIMCSRLYLGVHHPSDVLAGFALGIAVALFWELIYRKFYGARYYALAALTLLALLPLFFFLDGDYLQAAALLAGAAVFLPWAGRIAREPKGLKRLWRIPLGIAPVGAVALVGILLPVTDATAFLGYFLIAGGATLGAHALFRLCKV